MTNDSQSSTTGSVPSAPNLGSVASLAERLKAKTQSEAIAIQQQTQNELELHQKKLSELSSAALDTTRSVIDGQIGQIRQTLLGTDNEVKQALSQSAEQIAIQSKAINQDITKKGIEIANILGGANQSVKKALDKTTEALGQTTEALTGQQKDLAAAMSHQTKQLIWLMKLPVLVLLVVCLLICAGTWGWARYQLREAEQTRATLKLLQSQVAQQQESFTKLWTGAWGLTLQEDSTGKYVLMPPGVEPSIGYNNGARQAVRLGKK